MTPTVRHFALSYYDERKGIMSTSVERTTVLAEHVRARRIELGLSYSDLALRLKSRGMQFSRQAISLWERGKRERHCSDDELWLLADALGCTVEELWAGL